MSDSTTIDDFNDSEQGDVDTCPDCGGERWWVECYSFCDEGTIDAYEDDAINNSPGDFEWCRTCGGNGGWWHHPTPCTKTEAA